MIPAAELWRALPDAAPALQALHAPMFDPPWSVDAIAEQLRTPGSAALAVGPAAAPLGFILFRQAVDEAEILILAVSQEHRRQGLGGALLEGALGLAEAGGARAMWLEVAVDNAPALVLYTAAGFSPAGRRPRYYQRRAGGPVDALLLRRALGRATS